MNDSPPPSSPNPQPVPPPYPPYTYPPYQVQEDEINLLDYWRVLTRYKWMIVTIIVLSTATGIALAYTMIPIYRAEVLLAPVSEEENGSMSALASQFGGLASLAGISLGSGGSSTEQALATLRARSFLVPFIEEHNLLPVFFADIWNEASKSWISTSRADVPTKEAAYEMMKSILTVNADKKRGLVTLAVEWKDPQQAAQWANELVARLNRHEKQLAIKETEQSIDFLKNELAKTSVLDLQQAIYRLLEAQTKKVMLANARDQYAFKIIDPAVVPEQKIKPNKRLIVGLSFMSGLVGSVLLAFLLSAVRKHQPEGESQVPKTR